MSLPAPYNPISASMINVEADRASTFNAPLSGQNSTPQVGSLVKLYAPPNSTVNQTAPHSYSEFYSKTWGSPSDRQLILYQEHYYGNNVNFANRHGACSSSAWASGGNTAGEAYYDGVLANGTVLYSGTSGTGLEFNVSTGTSYISLKTSSSSATVTVCTVNASSVVANIFVCATPTRFYMASNDYTVANNYSTASAACNNQPNSACFQIPMYHTNVNSDPLPSFADFVFYDEGRSIPLSLSPDCATNGGCYYLLFRDSPALTLKWNSIGIAPDDPAYGSLGPGHVFSYQTECSSDTYAVLVSATDPAGNSINVYYRSDIFGGPAAFVNTVGATAYSNVTGSAKFPAGTGYTFGYTYCENDVNLDAQGEIIYTNPIC